MFAKFGCTSLLFLFVVLFVVLVRLAWFYLTDYMIVRFGEENPGLIAGAQGWQAEDGNNAHLQVLGSCDGGDYEEREEGGAHGIRICIKRKKLTMVNFLIFGQKNVSTIRFQEIKIRPLKGFEKMRFLCFYIIKSMARKGYFGPKSDFRGSKIPPRGASST